MHSPVTFCCDLVEDDAWPIRAASAKSVGHPAPFPIELPQHLIELYTFEDELVLDPFMGSGTQRGATSCKAYRSLSRNLYHDSVVCAPLRLAGDGVCELVYASTVNYYLRTYEQVQM